MTAEEVVRTLRATVGEMVLVTPAGDDGSEPN
jgi:hypothetical protein